MRVVLIGADNEENLGMAMIAASLKVARHQAKIVGFTEFAQLDEAVSTALGQRPEVIGLAMQFQHRGWEFTALAERLRAKGFRGHMTAGGQFATMAHGPLLGEIQSLDSVVLYDGEETIVELVNALRDRRSLAEIPGLAVRLDDGCVRRTAPRPLPQDLDQLALPMRYRAATRHFEIPFVPMSGGRGCWGKCAFCSITSFYRQARRDAGGIGFRLRSVPSIAAEMAHLTRHEESPCIFCFHDETLLLPRAIDTQKRLGELSAELARLGVEHYGLVGKCRPDCMTEELAKDLVANKVIRLYVGIENASQAGQDHLARRTRTEQLDRALSAVNQVGIFSCYNLLVFEPETTLDDVRENVAFIRNHASNPVNFCRAEPYHGTPLWERLKASGELEGSWLGWDYHLRDPKAELLFRMTSVVFRQRNFDAYGVANRSMSIGYMAQVIRHFYNGNPLQVARIADQAEELTRQITLDTARFFEQCLEAVERHGTGAREAIERETVRIGMHLAARDAELHAQIDRFIDDAERYVASQRDERRFQIPARLVEAFTGLALAGCVAGSTPGCGGTAVDPVPSSGGITGTTKTGFGGAVDPAPISGGRGTSFATGGAYATDPLPISGGRTSTTGLGGYGGVDPAPGGGGRTGVGGSSARGGSVSTGGAVVYDPPPIAGGRTSTTSTRTTGGAVVYDPPPIAGGRTSNGGTSSTGAKAGSAGRAGSAGNAGTAGSSTRATGGYMIVDPLPPTGGFSPVGDPPVPAGGRIGASLGVGGGMVADPLPPTGGTLASNESPGPISCDATAPIAMSEQQGSSDAIAVGHFRDTHARRTVRSEALALHDPPDVRLDATRERGQIRVRIRGLAAVANTRWASRGKVTGSGVEVVWSPENKDDQLRVAIRTFGGVTVAAIRAKDVPA